MYSMPSGCPVLEDTRSRGGTLWFCPQEAWRLVQVAAEARCRGVDC